MVPAREMFYSTFYIGKLYISNYLHANHEHFAGASNRFERATRSNARYIYFGNYMFIIIPVPSKY